MAYDNGHADLFGASTLLSRMDLSDDEVIKDAAYQLDRCVTPFDFASWAGRWGRALIGALQTGASSNELQEARDAAEDAEAGARAAEDELEGLKAIAQRVISGMDAAMEGAPDELVNRVNDLIATLENAL